MQVSITINQKQLILKSFVKSTNRYTSLRRQEDGYDDLMTISLSIYSVQTRKEQQRFHRNVAYLLKHNLKANSEKEKESPRDYYIIK